MGPADSDKITRVSPYSGYHKEFAAFRLQGYHLVSLNFPEYSTILQIFDSMLMVLQPQYEYWFGLFPFRSPLLRKSIFLSFPPVTKMFQFTGLLSTRLFNSSCDTSALPLVGSPIRKSPDQSLLTATRSIALFVTSFISF